MATPLYSNEVVYDSGMSAYWDDQTMITGTNRVAQDPGVITGSVVQVTFSRTETTGVREDLAMFDLHHTVRAGLGVYSRLDDTDMGVVETALDTLWTSLKVRFAPHIVLNGYIWRHWGADYPRGTTGLSKPSPIARTTVRAVAGTLAGTTLPDQVAESITLKTASRRHWGRIYLPPLGQAYCTTEGRIQTAAVDAVSGAFRAYVNDLNDNARQIDTVVWSPKYRGFFSIASIQMDDTFDVIRSRRAKQTTYRKIYTS